MDGLSMTSTLLCLVVSISITFVRCSEYFPECAVDKCGLEDDEDMDEQCLSIAPSKSPVYCRCLSKYLACIKSDANKVACRGNIKHAAYLTAFSKYHKDYCTNANSKSWKGRKDDEKSNADSSASSPLPSASQQDWSSSSFESNVPPSCRYLGNNKFKHCASYGKPHLKTFDGKYETCRTNGTWTLMDNPYVFVQVTNAPTVVRGPSTTKIVVVIRSKSNLCTLEKRYEADSSSSLPNTFIDGTDRPGADETVTLRFQYHEGNVEVAEIRMKYIATTLIIRKVGNYLSFSVKIPEEVADMSRAYNADLRELCTAGCLAHEQLDTSSSGGGGVHELPVRANDRALDECTKTKMLTDDYQSVLTDHFLDWCVLDAQSAGVSADLVDTAHWALFDARDGDPDSLKNRTTLLQVPHTDQSSSSGSIASSVSGVKLLMYAVTSALVVCRFSL